MKTYVYQRRSAVRRRSKWQVRRRRFSAVILLAIALYTAGISLFVPLHVVAASDTAAPTAKTARVALNWPSVGQAAIGASGYGVLDSHNTDQVSPTASVIKTVMALCVLEKHPLAAGEVGPTLVMSQQDVDSYEWYLANHGSVMPVSLGQQLTERQALEAAMLRSANNLADSLAIWAFGSMAAYQTYATQYVQRIGMTHTTIGTDASGLDPSTTSTASDLVRLGLVAMKNPALAEIVNEKSAVIPEVGTINNTNNLLGREGIVGIKTGTDVQNKGIYLFASRYQPAGFSSSILIVGAVMGAASSSASRVEALKLLASAKQGFQPHTIFKAGAVVGSYQPKWSNTPVRAITTKDIKIIGWRGTPVKTHVSIRSIRVPAKAGTAVGTISLTRDGRTQNIGTATLATDVGRPGLWWRLTHPF